MSDRWTARDIRLTPEQLHHLRAIDFFTGDGQWASLLARHFFTPTYRALRSRGFITVKGLDRPRKHPREGFRRYRITAKGKAAVARAAPAVKAAADRLQALQDKEFQERADG